MFHDQPLNQESPPGGKNDIGLWCFFVLLVEIQEFDRVCRSAKPLERIHCTVGTRWYCLLLLHPAPGHLTQPVEMAIGW